MGTSSLYNRNGLGNLSPFSKIIVKCQHEFHEPIGHHRECVVHQGSVAHHEQSVGQGSIRIHSADGLDDRRIAAIAAGQHDLQADHRFRQAYIEKEGVTAQSNRDSGSYIPPTECCVNRNLLGYFWGRSPQINPSKSA